MLDSGGKLDAYIIEVDWYGFDGLTEMIGESESLFREDEGNTEIEDDTPQY